MPLVRTRGIILRSVKWGDADRIITVYSPHLGKMRGVARGARRMKSRFGGVLEAFGLVDVTLFQKTPESLGQISQIDLVTNYSLIRENLAVMTAAARMVKMVEAMTADRDPNPSMYAALVHGLESLRPDDDVALTSLLFQIHVLGHTGFRPQFNSCTECGKVAQQQFSQWFSPRLGGIVCQDCGQRDVGRMVLLSKGSVAFIEQARRLSISNLSRLKAVGSVREEVETAMEAYFYAVSGKSLPSFEPWTS